MREALRYFALAGNAVYCERYGSGHINETYLVRTDKEQAYILQKINRHVFADIPALMANIASVTAYLAKRDPDPRHTLRLVNTRAGAPYLLDAAGDYWRVYDFVTGSVCLDHPESSEDFYQSAVAFGHFQRQLADYPAQTLHETIPRFHDTPARYQALRAAAQKDAFGRLDTARAELAFALAREKQADTLTSLLRAGQLPLRVTHNDTKLNNVMLDAVTRKPLCVIDLDTVMPGLAAYDFGDSIRFGANSGPEDAENPADIQFSLPLYASYARGFLSACGASLTPLEKQTLPWGARLMTLECGVRFLTDYLQGDVYFGAKTPGHNLRRCRTQFKLVADMEQCFDQMQAVIAQNEE